MCPYCSKNSRIWLLQTFYLQLRVGWDPWLHEENKGFVLVSSFTYNPSVPAHHGNPHLRVKVILGTTDTWGGQWTKSLSIIGKKYSKSWDEFAQPWRFVLPDSLLPISWVSLSARIPWPLAESFWSAVSKQDWSLCQSFFHSYNH